jgi:hypothetical protein
MVTAATAQNIELIEHAGSSVSAFQPRSATSARNNSAAKQSERWTTEVLEPLSTAPIINLIIPSVTGAEALKMVRDLAGTAHVVISIAGVLHPAAKHQEQTSLKELPRPKRLVTTFEPHFRQFAIKRLQSAIGKFRESLGRPEAAASKAALRAALTEAYKQSVLNPETRNLASAVSLVQDFLRPHWSQISAQKLEGISEKLGWVAGQPKLSSHVLEKLYRDLVGVVGSRIVTDVAEDEDETNDAES